MQTSPFPLLPAKEMETSARRLKFYVHGLIFGEGLYSGGGAGAYFQMEKLCFRNLWFLFRRCLCLNFFFVDPRIPHIIIHFNYSWSTNNA